AQQLLNIPAGTYTVTVTSASGCSLAATYTLTQPTAVAIKGTVTQILCNNQNNGKIVATASGGTGAKTLLWNNGATTGTIQNLAGGTYTVTATDTKGCTGSATFTIVNPTPVSLALVSIVPASGGKWKVNLQGSGGTPFSATILHKYNYRLNGNTAWALTNWTGNKSFTLLPGVYDFGVRDKNNCEAIITVSVPTIAIAPPPNGDAFAREASATVKISPNPTNGLFNLEMQDLPFAPVSVEVFDLTGRQIRATNFDGDGAPATNQFDLRAEPAGVYFIRVSTEGFSKTLRLVKQ
ncbi:MAG: T9SS type A sorting domain-containing protein, partial [Saprospiraceae bacterium]